MRKRSLLEILVAIAVVGGAFYFVFFTEKGRSWLDRVLNQAFESIDALLASLDKAMNGKEGPEAPEPFEEPGV